MGKVSVFRGVGRAAEKASYLAGRPSPGAVRARSAARIASRKRAGPYGDNILGKMAGNNDRYVLIVEQTYKSMERLHGDPVPGVPRSNIPITEPSPTIMSRGPHMPDFYYGSRGPNPLHQISPAAENVPWSSPIVSGPKPASRPTIRSNKRSAGTFPWGKIGGGMLQGAAVGAGTSALWGAGPGDFSWGNVGSGALFGAIGGGAGRMAGRTIKGKGGFFSIGGPGQMGLSANRASIGFGNRSMSYGRAGMLAGGFAGGLAGGNINIFGASRRKKSSNSFNYGMGM